LRLIPRLAQDSRKRGRFLIGGDIIDKIEFNEAISDVGDSRVNFADDAIDAV
jgi:hypothetical protein